MPIICYCFSLVNLGQKLGSKLSNHRGECSTHSGTYIYDLACSCMHVHVQVPPDSDFDLGRSKVMNKSFKSNTHTYTAYRGSVDADATT